MALLAVGPGFEIGIESEIINRDVDRLLGPDLIHEKTDAQDLVRDLARGPARDPVRDPVQDPARDPALSADATTETLHGMST